MDIVEWNPGYYPDIETANPAQKACFEFICNEIDNNIFVDVGDNDSYLYYYVTCLKKSLQNKNRGQIKYVEGELAYIPPAIPINKFLYQDIDIRIRRFINLYGTPKPHVVKYIYHSLLFADLLLYGRSKQLSEDLESYFAFLQNHNIVDGTTISVVYYVFQNNIQANDYVAPDYFSIFLNSEINKLKNRKNPDSSEGIIAIIPLVLEADYQETKINYLYRMYEWVDGTITEEIAQPSEYFNESVLDTNIPFRFFYDDKLYIDHILVPQNEKSRDIYTASVIRLAENLYRESIGLPRIGEGWISETLLFQQIKAAFPYDEIEQHSHPSFLGRQHYDIYLPEYKIAIEYQGEQHRRSIEYFGGEEAFDNTQKRDRRKKELSRKNGVDLIEVFPGYEIEEVLADILVYMIGEDDPDYEKELSIAKKYVKDFTRSISISEEGIGKSLNTEIQLKQKKKAERELSDKELDNIINAMVATLSPSSYADQDWARDISQHKFSQMVEKLSEVEELCIVDLNKAYEEGKALMDSGYYAPAIYGCMAIILRKMKRTDEELQMLLQMKRDFGYTNYDARLRTLLRTK